MKKLNNKGEIFTGIYVFIFLAVIGHTQYVKGKWGPNGTERVEDKTYWYEAQEWRP